MTHIRDLVPDPENRRKRTSRSLGTIVESLHRVGAARSIVIDEDNVVHAGNGVLEAAAEAGITRVHVVEADGSTIVAVRRRGLTPEQKRDLAISDNRSAELAEWNVEQLRADLISGLTLSPWFSEAEQSKLAAMTDDGGAGGAGTADDLKSQFLIVVTCKNDAHQVQLLDRFAAEGIECKALVS